MKIGKSEFLLGADPECFIRDLETGLLVSAHGMLPGDKKNPFPVKHGAVQVDGMAAEFNIDPAKTKKSFIRNINAVLNSIREMLGPRYELVFTPTAHFGKELIDAQPDVAKELGCDPDYNAWTGVQNIKPDVDAPFRTGAGHIHIGWTNGQDINDVEHVAICQHLVKNLDYWSLPTTLVDTDVERRTLYGDAGAYRPKSYGVEYRTPSNFWIASDELMGWMWDIVVRAIKDVVTNDSFNVAVPAHATIQSILTKRIRSTIAGGEVYKYSRAVLFGINKKIGGSYVIQ